MLRGGFAQKALRGGAFPLVAMLMVAGTAWGAIEQAPTGQPEIVLLELLFTQNIGLFLGLLVTAMGIFRIVKQDATGGIVLMIVGACITLAPGVYNGARAVVCPITEALSRNVDC